MFLSWRAKRAAALCVLWLLVSIQYSPSAHVQISQYTQVRDTLIGLLYYYRVQRRWTRNQIDKTTKEIIKTADVVNESFIRVLATIDTESQFHYWVSSRPNTNGTRDFGLTQQNSSYYQSRCRSVLGRECEQWELFRPALSVCLMRARFAECRRYYGEDLFVCYNSAGIVGRNSGYQRRWLKSYARVEQVWKRTRKNRTRILLSQSNF